MNTNAFYAPATVPDLVELLKLKRNSSIMHVVAGATDFLINMKKFDQTDYIVIDLTHLGELKEIKLSKDFLEIGAAVTMTSLEMSDSVQSNAKALALAASRVGSTQIRNRATIGGNIINASQCADTVTASFALGAKAVLLNADGNYRQINVEELILGIGQTQINPDEVLFSVRIPSHNNTVYSSFSKVGSRKCVATSKINLAVRLVFKDKLVDEAIFYFGSIGEKAIKAVVMETLCFGRKWEETLLAELLELGPIVVDEAIPTRASRSYKRNAVKAVISDVFNDILNQREVI